jgi:ligand-binding sensor domain-containing protein
MTNHRTNHRIKAFVSLVFVLIIINFSLSQGPPPEWIVYNTSNSGLPDNSVSAIAIDAQGNKWIGTLGGLAKFDGSSWTVYNTYKLWLA